MEKLLMPKATAVWLIENTGLTFEQIGAFCGIHHLEVQGIANEEVAKGIRGVDPIAGGFLTREEIARGEADADYALKMQEQKRIDLPERKRKGARFVPKARRQDRPDAIAWFVRNHPEVTDAQVVKLIGTTKATIEAVRNRTHWNAPNIKPVDPVSLGLCSQIELDAVVAKAAEAKRRSDIRAGIDPSEAGLRPTAETVPEEVYEREAPADPRRGGDLSAEQVFGRARKPAPAPVVDEEDEEEEITTYADVFGEDEDEQVEDADDEDAR